MTTRSVLQTAFSFIYAGPVERVARAVGIEPAIEAGYSRVRAAGEWIDYRRAPDPYHLEVGRAGADFHLHNRIEYNRVSTLVGEREVLADFLDQLRPSDQLWDIGANIGTHSCLAAGLLEDGGVVAFEPHPKNFAHLTQNVALNDLSNLRTEQVALSDNHGSGMLMLTETGAGYGTHSLLLDEGVGSVEVPLRRGDALIADGLAAPTVLKIDVQGAELSVLRGLAERLAESECRLVLCEVHPPWATIREVSDLLASHGFEPTTITEEGTGVFRNEVAFVCASR